MNYLFYMFIIVIISIIIDNTLSSHCCQAPINVNNKCSNIFYDSFVLEYHCINKSINFIYDGKYYNDENSNSKADSTPNNGNDDPPLPLSLMNSTIKNHGAPILVCDKCDAKLSNSFIGILLFIAVLVIGIIIFVLFCYNNRDSKNNSQYLPIHNSPGSANSNSLAFKYQNNHHNSYQNSYGNNNNNNSNNNSHNNNNNNRNSSPYHYQYHPYYNTSPTSPYYNYNTYPLNPSLILYHQSRLLGNIHSLHLNKNNNNPSSTSTTTTNKTTNNNNNNEENNSNNNLNSNSSSNSNNSINDK